MARIDWPKHVSMSVPHLPEFGKSKHISFALSTYPGRLSAVASSDYKLRKFTLATAYPRSVLRDQKKSLRQLGLAPSAVLTVCPE